MRPSLATLERLALWLHSASAWFLAPAYGIAIIFERKLWFLAPLIPILILLLIPCWIGSSLFQTAGSLPAFLLHRTIRTRAEVTDEALFVLAFEEPEREIAWQEVSSIQQEWARPSEQTPFRFRDHRALKVELKTGETVWIDEINLEDLRAEVQQHEISTPNWN